MTDEPFGPKSSAPPEAVRAPLWRPERQAAGGPIVEPQEGVGDERDRQVDEGQPLGAEDPPEMAVGRRQTVTFEISPETDSFYVVVVDAKTLEPIKRIEDTLGPEAAEEVLVEASKRLRTVVRQVDTTARLRSSEFAILAEELKQPSDAVPLAHRLLTALGGLI